MVGCSVERLVFTSTCRSIATQSNPYLADDAQGGSSGVHRRCRAGGGWRCVRAAEKPSGSLLALYQRGTDRVGVLIPLWERMSPGNAGSEPVSVPLRGSASLHIKGGTESLQGSLIIGQVLRLLERASKPAPVSRDGHE
jgi:hypothetical protein